MNIKRTTLFLTLAALFCVAIQPMQYQVLGSGWLYLEAGSGA